MIRKGAVFVKIFIDTANIEEIRSASEWGILAGATTNPSLIAKEGRELVDVIKEITAIVNGPISAEVMGLEADQMITEGEQLASLSSNIVIKIPMTLEGLKAVAVLSKNGIKTNVTLIFSATQALMAARAGATYVSPFVGRLDDIGYDGIELIRDTHEIFAYHNINTEIISASIRHPMHVIQSAKAGADIATIPYKVLVQMVKHPLTDIGIEKFIADYERSKS